MASSRSLHTVHLVAFGAGNVVGLGVMSMAGIGIGITGTGLWLAALVGGLGGAFALVPQLLASSSGDYPGGQYQQVGTLLPPVFGGIVAYILCFLVFDISAYALSAAQLLGLPTLPTRLTAALVVALFLGVHMLGARIAAIAQLVMAVLLAAALGTYVAVTMPHVRLANLAHYTFLGSPLAFLFACVYMTFMMNGVAGVANYAAVADRPRVTVPRAMRVSLLLVVVAYALICVGDAGALPIAQVANRDLAVSLSAFVPAPVTVAFVVGGSAFALLTTLNAAVGCVAYPVASACADGWLSRELGERSARTRRSRAPAFGGHDRRGVPADRREFRENRVVERHDSDDRGAGDGRRRRIAPDTARRLIALRIPLAAVARPRAAIRARGVVHRRAARRPAADRMAAVHDEPSADHRQCRDIRHNGCRRCHREQI